MTEDTADTPDDRYMDRRAVTAARQPLPPEAQSVAAWRASPMHVASRMALAGEPVDVEMLRWYLDEYMRNDNFKRIQQGAKK
jgi:hypothetical protein